jgi:hypothetical protein
MGGVERRRGDRPRSVVAQLKGVSRNVEREKKKKVVMDGWGVPMLCETIDMTAHKVPRRRSPPTRVGRRDGGRRAPPWGSSQIGGGGVKGGVPKNWC